MHLILEIFAVLLLFAPLIWEVNNDKNGDAHISRGPIHLPSKKIDVFVRILIALIAGEITSILAGVPLSKAVFLSGAIHFFFFDYIIAYILIKKGIIKGHWYSYLGSKGMDNTEFWKNLSPTNKFLAKLIILIIAIITYFN